MSQESALHQIQVFQLDHFYDDDNCGSHDDDDDPYHVSYDDDDDCGGHDNDDVIHDDDDVCVRQFLPSGVGQ